MKKISMVVYGNNGIGKTYFVSQSDTAPKTLMINTDGNTHVFEKNGGTVVDLFNSKNMWGDFKTELTKILENVEEYKAKYDTLVIDVIDHLYQNHSNSTLKENGFETEMETYAGGFGSPSAKLVPTIRKEFTRVFDMIELELKKHFNIVYISYEGLRTEIRNGEEYSNIHYPAYLGLVNSNSKPDENRLLKEKVALLGRITSAKVKVDGKIENRRVLVMDQADEFNDSFNRFGLESPMIDPTLGKLLQEIKV